MATDAETIAQLQAERAELLRRIDTAVAEAARHATAAERARCLAAAARVGAFAACDEMLRDAPDAGETPPQAYGRGMAEGRRLEREECAAVVDAWHEELSRSHVVPGREVSARYAADVLRWVAEDIRARGSQEPPQRPEAPADAATPAPVAPSPAMGLPVAAAVVCEACGGSGRRPLAGQRPVRCDECAATGRVAMMVEATAAKWCPRCDGSGRRLHEGWRAVRCDECRTTGRVVAVASVAATRRCPACNGRGVRRYDDGRVDGCDACGLLGRVAAEGGE